MQSMVHSFAAELLRPRRYNYSQQPLEQFLLVHPQIINSTFRIPNNEGHLLQTVLFKPLQQTQQSAPCIVYSHGLGSNKMEVMPLVNFFVRKGYHLCAFDFGGSGRSEGDSTTYGAREKNDILAILQHLEHTQKYNRIVLWGRSMGAVASVLAMAQEDNNSNSKVQCLVLDSPFSSFERVALQLASKKSLIPQFMLSLLIQPLKQRISQTVPTPSNPFKMQLEPILKKLDLPLLLIYSHNDTVVNCSHSKQIISYCRRNPIQVIIDEDHNMQRPKNTLAKALNFIEESSRVAIGRNRSGRGISVASKEGRQSLRSMSKVKLNQPQPSAIKLSARPSSKSKLPQRHLHTISSTLNQSAQLQRKRIQTQFNNCSTSHINHTDNNSYIKYTGSNISLKPRRMQAISSLLGDNKIPQHRLSQVNKDCSNKENMKPALNLLRKNRFR